MPEYIPYQVTKTAAAGQAFRATPGAVSYAPNNLGVATRQGLPKFSRGAEVERLHEGITLLQYPQDVADDPQMGHYIIFEVSKVDKGAIKKVAADDKNRIKEFKQKIDKEINRQAKSYEGVEEAMPSDEVLKKMSITTLIQNNQLEGYKTPRELNKFMSTGGGAASGNSTSLQASSPKKSISTYIALYMPPTVSVQYKSNYGEQEIGMMAQIGHDAIKAFSGGAGDRDLAKGMLDKAGSGLKHMALAALDTVAPGAKALAALETGQIVTSRMELMFEGIGRRNFSYEFTFIPRSEGEAKTIEEIVKYFKLHMASNLVKGTGGKEYTIPDVFDIKYMYKNIENQFLNKISTCVLESLDVTYGGDKYQTYPMASTTDGRAGLPPSTTKISLGFQELELITKDMIRSGH